jgi:uncharacterized metal-binding protein YceD (DUF177 family)
LDVTRAASPQELADMVKDLGLAALDKLETSYRITSISGGGWRLAGTLTADVVQFCVITLEPVPARIEENFKVEFWRELEEPEGGEDKSVLEGADIEQLEDSAIPAGRIVFECLSAALDPYPRKEGAALAWDDPAAAQPEKVTPFSVLAKLKDQR